MFAPIDATPWKTAVLALACVTLALAQPVFAQTETPDPAPPAAATPETSPVVSPKTGDAAAAPADPEDLLAEEEKPDVSGADLPDMSKALVKMVLFMMLLLGLLVAGAVAFHRFARGKIKLGGTDRPLRIIDRLTLGPKSGVCLINACGRYLVLGIAEKDISVLLEVPITTEDGTETDFSGALAQFDPAMKPGPVDAGQNKT